MLNKWVEAAVTYRLPLCWIDRVGMLNLHAMTYMAENGGHKYRKVFSTASIGLALEMSVDIYKRGGTLDSSTLIDEVYWHYGWDPKTMIPVRDEMRSLRMSALMGNVSGTNWYGFWDWRKKK